MMDESYFYYNDIEQVSEADAVESTDTEAATAAAQVTAVDVSAATATEADNFVVLPDAADPPHLRAPHEQDAQDVSKPFHYEEEKFRLFQPVIGSEERRAPLDPFSVPEIEEDDVHPDCTLRALRAVAESSAPALVPSNASLRASDFTDTLSAFEQIYTRVTDAVTALQSDKSLRAARMFVASVYHTEKLYALAAIRQTLDLAKRSLPTDKHAAVFRALVETTQRYRAQVISASRFSLQDTTRLQTLHISRCQCTNQVTVRDTNNGTDAHALPWLLSVDLTDWMVSHAPRVAVSEWLHVVRRYASFPVASVTAPSVVDSRFNADIHWMPPCTWIRLRVPPVTSDTDLASAQQLLRALQPTVLDVSMNPVHEDLVTLVSDSAATRRLRCLRVRLDVHSQAIRNLSCLNLLFKLMQRLPPHCKRLEIVRPDFTYGTLIQHWERNCPALSGVAVVFIEPTSITNTVIQSLGSTKFSRLSIWKPTTSQVLHARVS